MPGMERGTGEKILIVGKRKTGKLKMLEPHQTITRKHKSSIYAVGDIGAGIPEKAEMAVWSNVKAVDH